MYLSEDKTDGAARVNKWMALLIQSRVALYEGTWEKYHTGGPFAVTNADPNKYFNKAVEATTKIIASGKYNIYTTAKPSSDYKELFGLQDYTNNTEVMFWKRYENDLSRGNAAFTNDRNFRMETPGGNTITKQLVFMYRWQAYFIKSAFPGLFYNQGRRPESRSKIFPDNCLTRRCMEKYQWRTQILA